MTKRLAIIPARGGSKTIPNKNIRSFCGRPMVTYILETALQCKLFDKIHVSTDCEEISNVVNAMGVNVDFMRPDNLADDFTPIMPVLKYVTQEYAALGEVYDEIWMLMACAPLIEPSDLIWAADTFQEIKREKVVLSVSPYPVPVEWAFEMDKQGGALKPMNKGMFSIRSQDLKKKYFDAGIYALYTPEMINAACDIGSDENYFGVVLPKNKAVDIDDLEDWELAELLYKGGKNKRCDAKGTSVYQSPIEPSNIDQPDFDKIRIAK